MRRSTHHATLCGLLLAAIPARAETTVADEDREDLPLQVIEKTVLVDAPVAAVWQAFTTTEGATTFFAPEANIHLELEGPYELYFIPGAPAGSRGSEGVKILSYLPERMLSFTWYTPPGFTSVSQDRTWVVVLFEPRGARQTKVTLSHLGWREGAEWRQVHAYFQGAWDVVLMRLTKRFVRGPIAWPGSKSTPPKTKPTVDLLPRGGDRVAA